MPDPVEAGGRNGPALWTMMLDALDLPGAVVAGGAIRDYLLCLEPKDIDIFVPLRSREALEQLCEELNHSATWDLTLIPTGNEREYDEAFDGELVGVLEGEAFGLPVNIVVRKTYTYSATAAGGTTRDLIEGFDFGILQWSFADGQIISTTAALADLANRTATLTRDTYYKQSVARFARFNERNPHRLRFIDPYQGSFNFAD